MSESRAPADVRRVGMVFSGGPAPGANAVIAAAASAFRRSGREVVGLLRGYTGLHDRVDGTPLREGVDYRMITDADLRGLRNQRGVMLGTARTNPGREVNEVPDLDDPHKTEGLARVYASMCELELDALISIGGDGTLRTANLLYEYQRRLPASARRVRVVHLPKTIDNDYAGIDFTFGFFTAVDVMAKELLNLRADAVATQCYYLVSTMGRRAGWLAYGVGIAGEAHLTLGIEDVRGALQTPDGKLDPVALVALLVELIEAREARGKRYGVVVLAEGLAEMLPDSEVANVARDAYGHISFSSFDFGRTLAGRVAAAHKAKTARSVKITGVQIGYESRCAAPHAFDVLLGSQLGIGAYRALVDEGLDGHMVSISGQLDLRYLPFAKLIAPGTLTPAVRFVDTDSDFHRMARGLATKVASLG
jgi:ATP-dependent phosphofructokinase / diphosphate-dependent phosphofructokinase